MFDVGFAELLIIGIIALVVVGPERLPGLMRTLGLWVGRARASFASIREEVEREARLEGLRDTERAIRDGMTQTQQELHRTADDVRSAVSDHGDSADTGTADPVADDTAGATDRVTEPREPGAEEGANDDVASAGEGRRT